MDEAEVRALRAEMEAEAEAEPTDRPDLLVMAREKFHIQRQIKFHKSEIARLTSEEKNLNGVIRTALDHLGTKTSTLTNGCRLERRDVRHYGCLAQDRDQLYEWLRAQGAGDLIKPTVHSSSLKAYLKAHEAGGGELPAFVTVFDEQTSKAVGLAKVDQPGEE